MTAAISELNEKVLPDHYRKHFNRASGRQITYVQSQLHALPPSFLVQVEFMLNPLVEEGLLVSSSELLMQAIELAQHPVRQHDSTAECEQRKGIGLKFGCWVGSIYVCLEGVTLVFLVVIFNLRHLLKFSTFINSLTSATSCGVHWFQCQK